MKKLSKVKKKEMKFLNLYYNEEKEHDDEVFLFSTYPNIKEFAYIISNYGQVISYKDNKKRKGTKDKDGYYRLGVQMEHKIGERKIMNVSIHRLVAWEYCDKPDNCDIVNHLDCNVTNNNCENLEWTTVQGNTLHAIEHGLTVRAGCHANGSKYPEELILEICKYLEDGLTPLEVYHIYYPGSIVENHRNFYLEIYNLKYDSKYLYPVRCKFNIPTEKIYTDKRPWDDKELSQLVDMIKSGKTNKEILNFYGFKAERDDGASRVRDKTAYIRKKLNIPNPYIKHIQKMKKTIVKLILDGKTDNDIVSYYNIKKSYSTREGIQIHNFIYKARKQLNIPSPDKILDSSKSKLGVH